ncbi:MAG: hypothetical protein WC549_09950, partial [Actinomycetota bacterium]
MSLTYDNTNILNYLNNKISKIIKAEDFSKLLPEERLKKIEKYLKEIVDEKKIIISQKEIYRLAGEINEDSFGFGPVSFLINDEKITEIMINNFNQVYIEENDVIKKTDITFR